MKKISLHDLELYAKLLGQQEWNTVAQNPEVKEAVSELTDRVVELEKELARLPKEIADEIMSRTKDFDTHSLMYRDGAYAGLRYAADIVLRKYNERK